MKQIVYVNNNFITEHELNELSTNTDIEVHIKDLGNGKPQEFIIPSIVTITLYNVAVSLIASAVYDGFKYLSNRVRDNSKRVLDNSANLRISMSNVSGANVDIIYDNSVADTEILNAIRIVPGLSKDNYIIIADKERGIRLFTMLQFAKWKHDKQK